MTADKARKSATRQRMAETGEPYSVARHAVQDEHDDDVEHEPDEERAAEEAVRRGRTVRRRRAGSR